jgi:hypothetical protein
LIKERKMLRNAFSRLKKPKSDQGSPDSSQKTANSSPLGEIAKMLSASGRIGLVSLRKIAEEKDKEIFMKLIQHPVLAGSAIQAGRISDQEGGGDEMNRTQIFEPSNTNPGASAASEALRHAIYPLVKGEYSTTSSRSFTIGRIDGNDMIMPDFAISKKHAVINRDDGAYYIKDLGSTNGTLVNGTRLDKKPVKIHDKDVLSFARYEFTFLLPASLHKMLRGD